MPSHPTIRIEKEYWAQGFARIAGLDEVGKGAWAGPVVSAAVILPEETDLPGLNDSKMLSASQREELFLLIKEQALAYSVGLEDAWMVDEVGLAEAHRRTMQKAVKNLSLAADLLLVDGMGIKQLGVKSICIIKGDQKVRCIAAASIIAKVTRDALMKEYDEKYPGYGFADHKGYGTHQHTQALLKQGVCAIHRLSYEPVFRGWQGSLL